MQSFDLVASGSVHAEHAALDAKVRSYMRAYAEHDYARALERVREREAASDAPPRGGSGCASSGTPRPSTPASAGSPSARGSPTSPPSSASRSSTPDAAAGECLRLEVDQAIQGGLIADDAAVAGAWATLHQVRGPEVVAAFRNGVGPMSGLLGCPAGGAASPIRGVWAIATACGNANAFRLQTYPNA
jgi:hypothetical protein